MRLVGISMPESDRGPVRSGLPVEVLDHPLEPLDPGEALRREAHLRGEPPAQGPRQQPDPVGHRTHRLSLIHI